MRRLRDNCHSSDGREVYQPNSSVREGAYRLASPFLIISCAANTLREIVDYYVPIEFSKRSEFWRGLRETFLSTSTMFADNERKYGVDFHDAIAKKGEMRKTHVVRHTGAQVYDIKIAKRVFGKYLPPFSWYVSAIHDVLYNVVNPLIPNKTLREDAMRLTELLRSAKLFFNCPGGEELANIGIKYYAVKYRAPIDNKHDKTIGSMFDDRINNYKQSLNEAPNGLEGIVCSADLVKETASVPNECMESIIYTIAEHKFYRNEPNPLFAVKIVIDDARRKIVGKPHPRPWRRSKRAYSFIKSVASSLHDKVITKG